MSALKARSGQHWRTLFDERYMRPRYPHGSGVWGKKEFVLPDIQDEDVVSLYEGGTNLFWAERLGRQLGVDDLWVKQCGNSHSGSFKDLGITVVVSAVRSIIRRGGSAKTVICASTGDTSASVAAYCAAAEIPCVILLPNRLISSSQLVQPLSNGALTLSLDTDFDGCMAIVKRLSRDPRFYLANSMNPLRIEGQKTVSVEIAQQFEWEVPDWVIVPGGNLGNVTAIGRGFQLMADLGIVESTPRLVCAQAHNANPLYRSYMAGFSEVQAVAAEPTLASAIQIGNPVNATKAISTLKALDGIVEEASEQELVRAAAVADSCGLLTCPQTGVALAALTKLRAKGVIKQNDRVVVISTANGLKFVDFKSDYHAGALANIEAEFANRPIRVDGTFEAVTRELSSIGSP